MNFLKKFFPSALSLMLLLLFSVPATAQNGTTEAPDFSIKKNSVVTSFNMDWAGASRDDNYNHEFERSHNRLGFSIDALWFINDNIGIGPILGYQYLKRHFETPGNYEPEEDIWQWDVKYGLKTGYYAPVQKLFHTNALGGSHFFVTGGINWLRNQQKRKYLGQAHKFDPNTAFGYQISTGILVPVGKKIGLEWKIQRESRKREYALGERDNNGNLVITDSFTKWPSVLSFGLGLKVRF